MNPQVFANYSAYYDLLYSDKDYQEEAEYIYSLIEQSGTQVKSILELGCGTGKHAELLTQKGIKIHGIDLSSQMIEIARQKQNSSLTFTQGDVRTYECGKKFDAVISLFHVASYQTSNQDMDSFIKTARKHLNPDGLFIFDFWYGPAVLTDRPIEKQKTVENELLKVTRNTVPELFPNLNMCVVNFDIEIQNKPDGRVAKIQEKHPMRYYFLPELTLLLSLSSFEIIKFCEWMKETEPGFESWNAVIVAKSV